MSEEKTPYIVDEVVRRIRRREHERRALGIVDYDRDVIAEALAWVTKTQEALIDATIAAERIRQELYALNQQDIDDGK